MRFITILLACLIFAKWSQAQMEVPLPQRDVVLSNQNGQADFGDAMVGTQPGEPSLPTYTVTVILPPEVKGKQVSVALEDAVYEDEPDNWSIPPVPPFTHDGKAYWPGDKNIVEGKDMDIYGADAWFPASAVGSSTYGACRQYQVFEVRVFPYAFNPVTKKLRKLVSGRLVLTGPGLKAKQLKSLSAQSVPAAVPGLPAGHIDKWLRDKAVNPEDMDEYTSLGTVNTDRNSSLEYQTMSAPTTMNYVVITTRAIIESSAVLDFYLQEVDETPYLNTMVVDETVWNNGQSIDATTGDERADNIRAWLQANYLTQHIYYVLLIGNPDPVDGDVPMKRSRPTPGIRWMRLPSTAPIKV